MTRRTFHRGLWAVAAAPLLSRGQDAPSRGSGSREAFALALKDVGGGLIARWEVSVSGRHCSYHNRGTRDGAEIEGFERELSESQVADLQGFARRLGLAALASQDYKKQPLAMDQPTYDFSLSLDGRSNAVRCGIPNGESKIECQQKLDQLRIYLNSLLKIKIPPY